MKYNPLNVCRDSFVKINDIDYSQLDFKVKEITVWRRMIGGSVFYFTDYVLVSHKVGETKPTIVRIRCTPNDGAMEGDVQFTALWMELYKEFGFDQDFLDVVENTANGDPFDFTNDDTNALEARYCRMTGPNGQPLKSAYLADTRTVTAKKGELDETSFVDHTIKYWDFYRQLDEKGVTGQNKIEYCFVEANTKDGWNQVWTATEIASSNIQVL